MEFKEKNPTVSALYGLSVLFNLLRGICSCYQVADHPTAFMTAFLRDIAHPLVPSSQKDCSNLVRSFMGSTLADFFSRHVLTKESFDRLLTFYPMGFIL